MEKKYRKKMQWFGIVAICFLILTSSLERNIWAEIKTVEEAKSGIVEIYSGIQDQSGKFWKMKSGSGFLIGNSDGNYYIITNNKLLKTNQQKKIKFCKREKIATDSLDFQDVVKVVVRGDTTVTANILTGSKQQDYGIITVGEGLKNKQALTLGDSKNLTDKSVYCLGFLEEAGESIKYEKQDVIIRKAKFQKRKDDLYECYSKNDEKLQMGGPILDQMGYVVGVNCQVKTQDGMQTVKFIPIHEVEAVLKNFSINVSIKSPQKNFKMRKKRIRDVIYGLALLILILLFWFVKLVKKLSNDQIEELLFQINTEREKTIDESSRDLKREKAYVVIQKSKEKIEIKKDEFSIGKSPDMDLVIKRNPAISRKHVRITFDKGEYYIEDLGSSNGTFINREELKEGRKKALKDNDQIILANDILIFKRVNLRK